MRLSGVSASASNSVLVGSGATACADLARREDYRQIAAALEARRMTTYEAYLAIILAAQYQCPGRIPEATQVMVDALDQLPATA
jgi:hypothetical protein